MNNWDKMIVSWNKIIVIKDKTDCQMDKYCPKANTNTRGQKDCQKSDIYIKILS